MIGGGWRVRTWRAPRQTLNVVVAAGLLAIGARTEPVIGRTVTPATGALAVRGTTPITTDQQPAVRWNGYTSRGRWVRAWGPHPTVVEARPITRAIPCGAVAVTGSPWYPGLTVISVAGGPKLVWRSGLNSYIGRLMWGPTGGSVNDTAKATPPTRVTLASDPPTVALDTSGTDRTARICWAEFETPDPDRALRVSWAELETPDKPIRLQISWAEFQVPEPPRSLRVSWAELEVPTAPVGTERRVMVSWAEFQVPIPIDLTAPTPASRTFVVPRESRTWVVPRETRTWKVR